MKKAELKEAFKQAAEYCLYSGTRISDTLMSRAHQAAAEKRWQEMPDWLRELIQAKLEEG